MRASSSSAPDERRHRELAEGERRHPDHRPRARLARRHRAREGSQRDPRGGPHGHGAPGAQRDVAGRDRQRRPDLGRHAAERRARRVLAGDRPAEHEDREALETAEAAVREIARPAIYDDITTDLELTGRHWPMESSNGRASSWGMRWRWPPRSVRRRSDEAAASDANTTAGMWASPRNRWPGADRRLRSLARRSTSRQPRSCRARRSSPGSSPRSGGTPRSGRGGWSARRPRRGPRTWREPPARLDQGAVGGERGLRAGDRGRRPAGSRARPTRARTHLAPSSDASAQARAAFAIVEGALAEAGFTLDEVVRTRMYVVDPADADAVAGVHGEIFTHVRPATLVVVAGLMHRAWWSRWKRRPARATVAAGAAADIVILTTRSSATSTTPAAEEQFREAPPHDRHAHEDAQDLGADDDLRDALPVVWTSVCRRRSTRGQRAPRGAGRAARAAAAARSPARAAAPGTGTSRRPSGPRAARGRCSRPITSAGVLVGLLERALDVERPERHRRLGRQLPRWASASASSIASSRFTCPRGTTDIGWSSAACSCACSPAATSCARAGIAIPTTSPTSPPTTIPTDGPSRARPRRRSPRRRRRTISRRPVISPTARPAIAAGNTMSRPRTVGSGMALPSW